MLRTCGICSDVRQVDVGLLGGRELDLGFLGGIFQTLQSQLVVAQVNALLALELVYQVVDDAVVEVFTTQVGVTVGRQYFEGGFTFHFVDLDDGDVEGTAAQVIDGNLALALDLVHAIGEGRSSRFVDDAFYIQTGDATGILGGLTLGVVEVGRYCDDRFGHRLAQVILGGLLHLLQHFGRDLRRCHLLAFDFYPGVTVVSLGDGVRHDLQIALYFFIFETTANQTLDSEQRVLRVGDGLALGRLTNQDFAVIGIGNDGRSSTVAFRVLDHASMVAIQNSNAGVGSTQVNTDDFTHLTNLQIL